MTDKKVVIVDYRMGNLYSIERAISHAGGSAVISSSPSEIEAADRLILPGVGAFGKAMEELKKGEL